MINVKKVIREHYVKRVIFIILENKANILHIHNLNAGHVKSKFILNYSIKKLKKIFALSKLKIN
jgi:hypothetical protein